MLEGGGMREYLWKIRRHTADALIIRTSCSFKDFVIVDQLFHDVAFFPSQGNSLVFSFIRDVRVKKVGICDEVRSVIDKITSKAKKNKKVSTNHSPVFKLLSAIYKTVMQTILNKTRRLLRRTIVHR